MAGESSTGAVDLATLTGTADSAADHLVGVIADVEILQLLLVRVVLALLGLDVFVMLHGCSPSFAVEIAAVRSQPTEVSGRTDAKSRKRVGVSERASAEPAAR